MPARPLICHPSSACPHVRSLAVCVERTANFVLALRYTLIGRLDRLRIPGPASPARADNLWRHTCFEAFVRKLRGDDYYEFNFSTSRQWAAYRFDGYRAGMTPARLAQAPTIAVERTADSLDVAVQVDLSQQSSILGNEDLLIALSAVLEDDEGQITYWALRHPPGKADFHHTDGFAASLSANSPA